MNRSPPQRTAELERIMALPRRPAEYPPGDVAAITDRMTRLLRTPHGSMALRPIQAVALFEIGHAMGGFLPIRVSGGKCLQVGTQVMLFSGRTLAVENIRRGDLLMGPDSKPRLVLATTRGRGPLYRVHPMRGEPWVCNDAHVLTLVDSTTDQIVDIDVQAWLKKSGKFRAESKQFAPPGGVDFHPAKPLPLDPYFLGVWYGDGTKLLGGVAISKPDPEIYDLCVDMAKRFGLTVRTSMNRSGEWSCATHHIHGPKGNKNNPLLTLLRRIYGDGERLPFEYLTASREDRMLFLAGLLDSDGYLNKGVAYEICQVRKAWADDVAFLARSLGFSAHVKEKIVHGKSYWRMQICGNVEALPLRIFRKQARARTGRQRCPTRTGIHLEAIEEGDYAGFELDGDGRFLLGDFTVTHNSLVSLLAPTVLGSKRPLLLVPAALVEATRRKWRMLAEHWRIYPMIDVRSYQWLTRVGAATYLDDSAPDAIILDECHKAKDLGRSVARRLRRYLEGRAPRVPVVAMTGTVTKRSIRDYAHIVGWALGPAGSPLPNGWNELDSWAYALDPQPRAEVERGEPPRDAGALRALGGEDAREGYQARLRETFGVVSTRETSIEIPILIERIRPVVPQRVRDAIATMRETWETPTGEDFTSATSMWRHCRELACGFHYRWDPPPPKAWVEARRAWSAAAREIHTHGRRGLDTTFQITQAVDAGHYPEAEAALAAWRAIEPTFKPRTVPVWLDDYLVQEIAADAAGSAPPTWYWTEHTAFAHALRAASGMPYYGREASDDVTGRNILDHPRGSSGILSYDACREGLDLQYVARNVFCFAPTDGARIEQALGRTHRDGQEADEIVVRIVVACDEHERALDTLVSDAHYIHQTTGQEQKVLLADWTDA